MIDVFQNLTLNVVLETDVASGFVFIEIDSEINENPSIKIVAAAFSEYFSRRLSSTVIVVVSISIELEISVFKNGKGKHAVSESLVVLVFVLSWIIDCESKYKTIFIFQIGIIEFEPSSNSVFS